MYTIANNRLIYSISSESKESCNSLKNNIFKETLRSKSYDHKWKLSSPYNRYKGIIKYRYKKIIKYMAHNKEVNHNKICMYYSKYGLTQFVDDIQYLYDDMRFK